MANLIYDNTVTSAVTQVDIDLTSTPIEKGELYELVMTILNPTVGGTNFGAFPNDDITTSNFYIQLLQANGTGTLGDRKNENIVANNPGSNKKSLVKAYLKLTNDGHLVFLSKTVRDYGGSLTLLTDYFGTSTPTYTNITKLSILASSTNGINTNSRIQLYKVAEKVDEVIVSGSPVTQVDFTTDIQKGNEYLLVSDITTGSTDSAVGLFINSDTTPTNYYNQDIVVISNTYLQAQRVNTARFTTANTGTKSLGVANIKLANSGFFNCQSQVCNKYGGSNVLLEKYSLSKTATVSSITGLSIISDVANALGIGSRFELYRLI